MKIDLNQVDAIFIDLDGTLANSIPTLFQAYCSFLQKWGIEGTLAEFRSLTGPTIPEALARIAETHNLDIPIAAVAAQYEEQLLDLYANRIAAFPEARQFLRMIHTRNLPICLVTSASHTLARAFINSQGLEELFTHIITAYDVPASKPHPDIYLKALEVLNLPPERGLAIEDALQGVQAATSAGIPTLWLSAEMPQRDDYLWRQFFTWEEIIQEVFRGSL